MFPGIPEPLRDEHQDFHAQLERLMKEPGPLGSIGRDLERLLRQHCEVEESFALPPLGLLQRVSRGEISADMAEIVPMTSRLKSELPRLFAEHKQLNALGDRLRDVAGLADRPEYVQLAFALNLHTRTEEEVLYPAAIVLGDLVAEELRQRSLVRS